MNNRDLITYLDDLRRKIGLSVGMYLIIFLGLLPFRNQIYFFLLQPLLKFMPIDSKMVAINVITPFLVPIKSVCYLSFVLTLPYLLFNLYLFIKPALYLKEKIIYKIIASASFILFLCGVLFGYYIILPIIFKFIIKTKADYFVIYTDIYNYLQFFINILLIFGICFLTPIIIFFLLYTNTINTFTLKKYRKHIFLLSFIIGAIITPPDILSQILFAIPMYLLFELGILLYSCFISIYGETNA